MSEGGPDLSCASGLAPRPMPASGLMSKTLTEQDIRSKFISPAVQEAGWDGMRQVREEVQLTNGMVRVRGKLAVRGKAKRADYVLYHGTNLPIAVNDSGQDVSDCYCWLCGDG